MSIALRTSLSLSLVAACLLAGEARPAAVRPGQKTALVTVVADAGTPIRNLTAKDFSVTEDGSKRDVVDAQLSDDPLSIVLLVDTTQPPLGASHPTQDLRSAVTTFIKIIRASSPDAQIALGEFAGASVTTVDFTSNNADLDKGIGRLAANPQAVAVLLEALADAGKKLAARPAPRRAIVTIDLHSAEVSADRSMKAAVTSIHDSGATLWPITVRGASTRDDPNREDVLTKASKANGGMRFSSIDASGLEANLKKVAASLTSQYVVTFARPGDGAAKNVTFETVGGQKVLLTPFMR